jgi:hypothetical protein
MDRRYKCSTVSVSVSMSMSVSVSVSDSDIPQSAWDLHSATGKRSSMVTVTVTAIVTVMVTVTVTDIDTVMVMVMVTEILFDSKNYLTPKPWREKGSG